MALITCAAALPLRAEEARAVPQAVAALEHLKAKPQDGPFSWTNGPYGYDGAGNIIAIGSESFVYDKVGRLKSATLRGPDLASIQTQTFTYDDYGNLTSTAKLGQTVELPVNTSTNRLATAAYDPAGNVVTYGIQHYDYDALGMLNAIRFGPSLQPRIIHVYTADDERLFSFDVAMNTTHWTSAGSTTEFSAISGKAATPGRWRGTTYTEMGCFSPPSDPAEPSSTTHSITSARRG